MESFLGKLDRKRAFTTQKKLTEKFHTNSDICSRNTWSKHGLYQPNSNLITKNVFTIQQLSHFLPFHIALRFTDTVQKYRNRHRKAHSKLALSTLH